MHKKLKAITGGLMAASMLASSVATIAPMSASAGSLLGQSDFEEGIGLPWHCCETQPAKQKFEIDDGVYRVEIVQDDGPESRWDLQFRHRGIKITAGDKYKISFDINASAEGELATHIADLKGENPVWLSGCEGTTAWNYAGKEDPDGHEHTSNSGNLVIKKGENHFEGEFTAKNSIEVAEWAFHYGGAGDYQDNDCFENGTVLEFDNMVLENLSSDKDDFDVTNEFGVIRPRSNVRLNQVGYYPNLTKRASYCTDNGTPCEYEIRDKSGKAVYTNTASKVVQDPESGNNGTDSKKKKDSGKYVQILDFSDFTTPGEYTIFVKDSVGVSDTISGLLKGAYDTKASGDKLMWTNPKSKLEWVMNESHTFRIDENIYDDQLVKDSINYFYQNRSGIDIESKYITSGDASTLAHKAGHTTDKAYVQSEWIKFYEGDFSDGDTSYSIDGFGGWYDAGDHGKYVVNGGISVWTLQNTYELSKKLGTDAKWTGDLVSIPEAGDKNPDILDEARWELEWMLKMIVDSKDPYYGSKYENFVYHKLHDHKWTGLATKAWDYKTEWGTERLVKPPTYAATLNLAACAAQAARLWKGIDDSFADECLEAAKKCYDAVKNSGDGYKVDNGKFEKADDTKGTNATKGDARFAPMDQAIGGGPYGDSYVLDDFYWAGCELYATTGDKEYYDDIKGYKNNNDKATGMDKAFSLTTNLGGGENKGSFSSFNWGCTSGLGTLTLFLNPENISADEYQSIVDSIAKAGDAYIKEMNGDDNGMGIPYVGSTFTDPNNIGVDDNGNEIEVTGYEWGSNSFVINNAMVLAYAYVATEDGAYLNGAAEAMDYIFGRNGLGFSYVSGYGDYFLQYPHHRWWANGVDPEFPMAPCGVLSGGPGAGMQDPYIGGLGYKRGTLASQKSYVDNAEAWSVNEVTINWNAPLVAMSSFMEDVVNKAGDLTAAKEPGDVTPVQNPTSATPTNTDVPQPATPAETPTSGSNVTAKLWGDATCDGEVNLADALLILQYSANANKYSITDQGLANADIVDNGGGVTPQDALALQMIDAGLLKQSQLPVKATDLTK